MMANKRINEIIRESIASVLNESDAVDYLNGINASHELTPWDSEGKMDRMRPSNASRSHGSVPTNDFRVHSYADWIQNWKPKGISYSKYMQMGV